MALKGFDLPYQLTDILAAMAVGNQNNIIGFHDHYIFHAKEHYSFGVLFDQTVFAVHKQDILA
jgi:hypothetical protein